MASDSDEESLAEAVIELVEAGLASGDEDTEEIWLCDMIFDDRLLRSPKTAAGVLAAWAGVGSKNIRDAMAASILSYVQTVGVSDSVEDVLGPMLRVASEPVAIPVPPEKVPVPPERTKTPPNRWDEFWTAYPKHVSKAGAKKIYDRLVSKGQDEQEIIDGALRYTVSRYGQDPQFTKQPTTWLNQGCWSDEYEQQRSNDIYDPSKAWE